MKLAVQLEELSQQLGELALGVDVSALSGPDAAKLALVFSSIERCAAASRVACGARAVEANVHLSVGARDGASWLASVCGSSVGTARAELELSSQLEALPSARDAVVSGAVSLEQARHIANGAKDNDAVAQRLLGVATQSSLAGLKTACRSAKVAGSPQSEAANYSYLASRRYLRCWVDSDGMVCGSFRLLGLDGKVFLSRLEPFVEQAFKAAKATGTQQSHQAYSADGFCALVESSGKAANKPRVEVVVIADHSALLRGHVEQSERCEIEGLGAVPVSLVRSLAQDCYLSQVVTKDGVPAIVKGKAHYIPNKLRQAVKLRDKWCQVKGCESTFRLEIDHIVAVVDGGATTLENLMLLCKTHHDQKTYRGFQMIGRGDTRQWLPPPQQLDPLMVNQQGPFPAGKDGADCSLFGEGPE